jgi:membrane fusion protein (multidrug efflux system)
LIALAVAILSATGLHAQPVAPVSVATADLRPIFRSVPMSGTVTSPRSARLSAATSGKVAALFVDVGAEVTAGDPLLRLDPELTQLQLEADEARLAQSRSALADARRRLSEARELIPMASISESAVRDLEAEVALDAATLQQVAAEVAYRRALLQRYSVNAPFSGVVSAKLTELGEWVTPGTAVLELVATEGLRLDFSVAEDFLTDIEAGAEVRYTLGSGAGGPRIGEIDAIVPVTDPGARTFLLRVLPGQSSQGLRPGMSVSAELKVATGRDGVVVPRDALLRYSDGRTALWIVDSDGAERIVHERRVQTGLQFNGLVELRSGIEAGVRVVVEGNETLQDGQRVEIRERTAAPARAD